MTSVRYYLKEIFYFRSLRDTFFFCIRDRRAMWHECVCRYRVCITRRWGSGGKGGREKEEEKGIDFSAGLCEMKPGRAIAINNDKNNPIRRLFDLSAPIFRARSIRLITILLDLGGEPRRTVPSRAEPS